MQQLKTSHMRYYILPPNVPVKNGTDYQIVKVKQVDEANFLEDYGAQVIVSGNNLMEALLNFEEWQRLQQQS